MDYKITYEIIEHPLMHRTQASWHEGERKLYVGCTYNALFKLTGDFEQALDLCFSVAKQRVKKAIDTRIQILQMREDGIAAFRILNEHF